jgi:hypothetical protein
LAIFKDTFYLSEKSIFRRLQELILEYAPLSREPVFNAWRNTAPFSGRLLCDAVVSNS